MDERDSEFALRQAEDRLTRLSRQVSPDPAFKVRLRQQLLLRHEELARGRQRPRLSPWAHLSRVKRVSLTLPPLCAAVAAAVVTFVAPMLAGHQSPQAAEAQRLTPALMRYVPTITGWEWTVQETVGKSTRVLRSRSSLNARQRVYVFYGQVYLWDRGTWSQPATDITGREPSSQDWQWGFTLLNRPLATQDFAILPQARIDGVNTEGIRTTLAISGQRAVAVTFWVERPTGLVLRLERDVTVGSREIEHDVVDYRYQRTT
jgi:hypothetical protein